MIVTMDKQRRIIRDGAIAIQDGEILEVGKTADILRAYKAEKTISASGHLATPGLIDCHVTSSIFTPKGLIDPSISVHWKSIAETSWAIDTNSTENDFHIGALGYFVEMIRHGTTCFAEIGVFHDYLDTVAEAMKETGIRGTIAKAFRDAREGVPESRFESAEENLRKCEQLIKKWNGAANGLIKTHVGIRFNELISDEHTMKAKEIADKYKTLVNVHCGWTAEDNEAWLKRTGRRPLAWFDKLGVLDENCLLVHMGGVNEKEIETLKRHNVKVCHCPLSSMFLGVGIIATGKIPEMVHSGVTVTLGSDSPECGFVDLVRLAHLAATAHNEVRLKENVISAQQAMEMLTVNGAKALLWEDQIGSIEKGKRADIVLFDMRGMEWHPLIDPVSRLIYSADGGSASTVIIDGKLVMENRKLLTVDEDQIRTDIDQQTQALRDRIGIKVNLKWPIT
jgi:5-methylthioadenosine/S-adenosylhomocysteine deaminase